MKIMVMDGQGGGVGRAAIERIKDVVKQARVVAVGTNALATSNMLKAGADAGASGENAVKLHASLADVIVGPVGILVADALMGEVTPKMAKAVGRSRAVKILIPVGKCCVEIAGLQEVSLQRAVVMAADRIVEIARGSRDGQMD